MTVYVDPIFNYGSKGKWCHMATDGDIDELHQMAASIGVRRAWFQDHPLHPHYDLTTNKRAWAVRNGAVEVSRQELALKISEFFRSDPSEQKEE